MATREKQKEIEREKINGAKLCFEIYSSWKAFLIWIIKILIYHIT